MNSSQEIICRKEVELMGAKYVVYIKEVATKLAIGGEIEKTTKRAFVKKL